MSTSWPSGAYLASSSAQKHRDFGKWRSSPVALVMAFSGFTDWAAIENPTSLDWVVGTEWQFGHKAILVTRFHPSNGFDGTSTYAQVASGTNDAHIVALATNLITKGLRDIILCPYHEFNLNGSSISINPGGVGDQSADMRDALRHAITVMRGVSVSGVSGNWEFMLNPSNGTTAGKPNPTSVYPGDSYVDHWWPDFYDRWDQHISIPGGGSTTDAQRWQQILDGGGLGLTGNAAFCRAGATRNANTGTGTTTATKELGFGGRETGMWDVLVPSEGGGGDNATYFTNWHAFLKTHQAAGGRVSGEVLFNNDGGDGKQHQLWPPITGDPTWGDAALFPYPLATAKYLELFGGPPSILSIRRTRTFGTIKNATDLAAAAEVATVLGTSGPYTGPKIWGANDGSGNPGTVNFDTLRTNTAAAGGVVNAFRSYHNQAASPAINSNDTSRHNAGAMLVIHMRTNVGVPDASKAWATIAAGTYDASVYDPLFTAMCNLNYGTGGVGQAPSNSIFTLDSEFDRLQTPKGGNHGTAAEFVAAWRHLYDRFRNTGPLASHPNNARVLFGFAPTGFGYHNDINNNQLPQPGLGSDRVRPCWPGDAYVDIHCPDQYNKLHSWSAGVSGYYAPQWHTMQRLFQEAKDWSTNTGLGRGKQLLIVEGDCQGWGTLVPPWVVTGDAGQGPFPAGQTDDSGAAKSQWFIDGANYLLTDPLAIGWCYWDSDFGIYEYPATRTGWESAATIVKSTM